MHPCDRSDLTMRPARLAAVRGPNKTRASPNRRRPSAAANAAARGRGGTIRDRYRISLQRKLAKAMRGL
jgi:hypothetical protein